MHTRRTTLQLLAGGTLTLGATTILPFSANAAAHGMNTFETKGGAGAITIHPIAHASFVMETPEMVIYADPVHGADAYSEMPAPDLILLTHEHGDHFDLETLTAIVTDDTQLITNPAVYEMLPEAMQAKARFLPNGGGVTVGSMEIEAIPAYNLTEDRMQYHPEGRDNGYVLRIDGTTVYIAGDTEDIPEMRALTGVDIAFVPFNLPYTMDENQAASAVAEFAPTYVYPYHYRGSDLDLFEQLLADAGSATEVNRGNWYGEMGDGA